ncbi:MAG TPA: hypothetical protein VF469_27535 [Kofleriaceae bacterium]
MIGLYVILRADDDAPSERTAPPSLNPTSVQKFADTTPGKPGKPRIPSGTVTENRTGEVQVRDHRAPEPTPIEEPPPRQPRRPRRPDGREIPSQLTSTLGLGIRPLLHPCTAGIPAEAQGPKARIEGEILISIKDHQAQITSATLSLRDVAEDARAAAEQCLARAPLGFVAPAGDESDIDDYSIALSLTLP